MSEDEDKRALYMNTYLLGSFCSNKEVKPTTRAEIDKDRALNDNIRKLAQLVRENKYFENLIIKTKTHEEFLDVWEALDYFVNKWAFPYRVLNDLEWKEEDDDLYGIGKKLMYETEIE